MIISLLRNYPTTNFAIRKSNSILERKAKPFLQWVGGKRIMITLYKQYLPKSFKEYYEPFLGGGAMFFYLRPVKSVLGDNNLELIKAYEGVRDAPTEVIALLRELKKRHSKDLYMAVREIDRNHNIFKSLTNAEIAARLIYLNQTCFNGVYRVNKKGQFNVPIGSSLNRLICDDEGIINASNALKKAKIYCKEFNVITKSADKDDFVYFDPPYFPVSVYSDFTRYTKEKFFKEDQIVLKGTIDDLTKRGCKVMLSNSDCDFINNLYKEYRIIKVSSNRTLNCKTDRRGKITELLILNY